MKTLKLYNLIVITFVSLFASSCSVVGGIFKTGMGVGVFLAVAVIVFIVVLMMRAGKGRN